MELTKLLPNLPVKNQRGMYKTDSNAAFGQQSPPQVMTADQVAGLKNAVLFGAENPEKLTYEHVATIQDPVLGNIEKYKFSNGMEFYGLQRKELPLVSYGELIKAGTADETVRNNGVAHFLEHLVFKGTKNIKPGETDKIIEGTGAGLNAFTWMNETFYYIYEAPKESLNTAIETWAELLSGSAIPEDELKRERDVVVEEIKRSKQSPDRSLFKELKGMVWPEHRSKWDTLGPAANIRNISRDEILRFQQEYYDPSNRAIVVIGDFDMKETLDKVVREHEKRPFQGKKTYLPKRPLKPGKVSSEATIPAKVTLSNVYLGFRAPVGQDEKTHREESALELLSVILGGGRSSRLHKALIEDRKDDPLASSVGMGMFSYPRDVSMAYIATEGKTEKLEEAKQEIRRQLDKIALEGVSETELKKARTVIKSKIANESEKQLDLISDLAVSIANGELEDSFGSRIRKYYDDITSEDIQEVVKKYLTTDKQKVAQLVPHSYAKKLRQMKAQKQVQFAGKLTGQEKSTILGGGTEVVTHPIPGSLSSAITVRVNGGRRLDSVPGETTILADMLQQGTQGKSAELMSLWLEERGIRLGTESTDEGLEITVSGLSEYKQEMMSFLSELLHNPGFREKDLNFLKEKFKSEHEQNEDMNPSFVSEGRLLEALYGKSNPYGYGRHGFLRGPSYYTTSEMIKHLDKITPETLRENYHQILAQPNLSITAVGDITHEELVKAAEKLVEPLPSSGKQAMIPKTSELTEDVVITESRAGLKQAEITRGWFAPNIREKDRVPLKVLEKILSGGLSSRLFQTFRENGKKAYCYSVRALYSPQAKGGDFRFYIGTSPENTREVLDLFQNEVNKLTDSLPTDEELKRSKLKLKSLLLSGTQVKTDVSRYLASHRALESDSNEELLEKIDQVTPEQIRDVARRYLGKPSITFVLAPENTLTEQNFPVNAKGPIKYNKPG